jgi:HK97 gp10 family phage protein
MAEQIEGLGDLKRSLAELTNDLKRKVIRAGLRDAAAPIAKQARENAPVLKKPATYRLPGTLKRSIITKASKRFNGQNGEIGVYVAVHKRKGLGGKASARNPFDPFYWRFQEFGTQKQAAKPFMGPAFNANAQSAISIFQSRLKTRIDKANTRK